MKHTHGTWRGSAPCAACAAEARRQAGLPPNPARHPRLAAILVSLLFALLALIAAVGFYVDPRPDDGGLHPSFTAGWVAWLLLFAVLEYAAVKRNPEGKGGGGDTLSEHVWELLRHPVLRIMAVGGWLWSEHVWELLRHPVLRIMAVGGWLWLTVHFFTPWL